MKTLNEKIDFLHNQYTQKGTVPVDLLFDLLFGLIEKIEGKSFPVEDEYVGVPKFIHIYPEASSSSHITTLSTYDSGFREFCIKREGVRHFVNIEKTLLFLALDKDHKKPYNRINEVYSQEVAQIRAAHPDWVKKIQHFLSLRPKS